MDIRVDQKAVLVGRQTLSPSCFALELACPSPLPAKPGQFVMVGVGSAADPLLRRPFSVAGVTPKERGTALQLLVKEVGKVTAMLRSLPLGSELAVLGPLGRGFDLASAGPRPVLVAGGIGLPPVLFAARELRRQGTEFAFFYGASSGPELLLRREIEEIAAGRVVFCTDDGSFGEHGLVTEVLGKRWQEGTSRLLACGPNPMLQALAALARERGVEAELSLEEPMACGVGVCLGCVVRLADGTYAPSCQKGPVFRATELSERW
ncbi:dihydroorotate dehydrogenase electron transfer subunit [Thermoanaerobaculum aquaticum]|nr:dihydroorotate dehydrogenase electron transfer subunit [Thermoanaerobaculum aquaticum]